MVKYATALRLGTAADAKRSCAASPRTTCSIRPTRRWPSWARRCKTTFLCRYLHSEELRREIQEGLNVVEHWNSANGFIFYGKGGEIATNRLEDQEVAMLACTCSRSAWSTSTR